jgi:hypothetical protein
MFKVRTIRLTTSIFVQGKGSSSVWTVNPGGGRPGDCDAITITPQGHFVIDTALPNPRSYFIPMTSVSWVDVIREQGTTGEDIGAAMDAAATAAAEGAKPLTKAKSKA